MPVGTAAGEGRCLREPKVVFSFDLVDDDWWLEVAMSGIPRHEVVDVSNEASRPCSRSDASRSE